MVHTRSDREIEMISKSCFDGNLSQSSKDKISDIVQEVYQSIEKSVQVLI